MVSTWIIGTEIFKEVSYREDAYDRLPAFRKSKVDQYRFESSKLQSIAAWTLWTNIQEKYQISPKHSFNLSHSHAYCICSLDIAKPDIMIGCDIERIGLYKEGIVRRFYHPLEQQQVEELQSDEAKRLLFYRLWVRKESIMKATRQGMALDMRSFVVKEAQEDELQTITIADQQLHIKEYAYDEYRLSICSSQGEFVQEINQEFLS